MKLIRNNFFFQTESIYNNNCYGYCVPPSAKRLFVQYWMAEPAKIIYHIILCSK